jgi:hypothetical protein
MRKPITAQLQATCDKFNAAHPVGTEVFLKKDFVVEPFRTTTRSTAQVLSGHSPVIWLEGVTGCYHLDCVTPILPDPPTPAPYKRAEKDLARIRELESQNTSLRKKLQRFVNQLQEMGFDKDGPINGGDTVEAVAAMYTELIEP